ncbi:formyltetrahydrofolate deformylase [Sphingosinicella sp. BN140058]|uniref:formyltetrahydrofolate deformylase n=1 Tax=Sphingosinicella sp. BN140058 TaxID=1892855 RepID=UPI0010102D10|nr:formyltetrahydrofolate deformylase [Sphingosinicella sp. BN140058]QAY78814.1 formyltetrahydrofolate deformylase [Sphingosinicella sp. BN140058]
MAASPPPSYILTFTAVDRVGIVAAASGFLAERDGFILDSQQYADIESGRFFMRVAFSPAGERFPADLGALRRDFAPVAERLGLDWTIGDGSAPMKVMIAVSKGSHCLNDLLHRWSTGGLPIDVTAVVSNHDACRALAEWHGVPYHHLPVTAETRAAQEAEIAALFERTGSELLVLARYMQVLSPALIASLGGRCINIHHSFLPSFKGANPYHRAHALGVKLIGATSHYVTPDLDEGPIIEQAVERIDHRASVGDMIRIGRDTEAQVLARAVAWAAERRILLNGRKTVVFR